VHACVCVCVERGKTLKTSPYMLFVKAERPKLVAANPQLAFGEVGRKLGEKWRALTEAQKSKYVAAAEKLDQQK
jgi:hypothetical protein